jgi:hypothetical protein
VPQLPLPLVKICDFGFSKGDDQSAAKSKVGAPPAAGDDWRMLAAAVLLAPAGVPASLRFILPRSNNRRTMGCIQHALALKPVTLHLILPETRPKTLLSNCLPFHLA